MNNNNNLLTITSLATNDVFGHSPNNFQSTIIPHILNMLCGQSPCRPVLLVQPTGGGKSIVYQTISIINGGVTIVIENTLALGSDQKSKIDNLDPKHNMFAFHLDQIKQNEQVDALLSTIDNLSVNNRKSAISIIIFTSPESLLLDIWKPLLNIIILNRILTMICIDEVHQFVEFGITFRKEFSKLKNLISTLMHSPSSPLSHMDVPILCMTATFNSSLKSLLSKMIGFEFVPSNTFWASRKNFSKRHISISSNYCNQVLPTLKKELQSHIVQNDLSWKAIICCNTATNAESIKAKFDEWLDDNEYTGDSILVVGSQESELKSYSTVAFTSKSTPLQLDQPSTNYFPRYLIGTSGCIGAGLDSSEVHSVVRIGCPSSIINLIQELGRCGRNRSLSHEPNQDWCLFLVNLSDYVYMNQRLFIVKENDNQTLNECDTIISKKEERNYQIKNLIEVASLFVLDVGCWHSYLEKYCAEVEELVNIDNNISCDGNCPNCMRQNKNTTIGTPVSRSGLTAFLCRYMLVDNTPYTPCNLAKLLHDYPNVGKCVFNRQRSKKASSMSTCEVTILQLIASSIIKLHIEEDESPKAICKLVVDEESMTPTYLLPQYWKHIITT